MADLHDALNYVYVPPATVAPEPQTPETPTIEESLSRIADALEEIANEMKWVGAYHSNQV